MAADLTSSEHYHQQTQTLLRVYAYYRTVLALILLIMFHTAKSPLLNILGQQNNSLFGNTINIYTAITLVTLAQLYSNRFVSSAQHMFLTCFVDILCLALLMHASGGVSSGLGLLLLVTVSAASITLSSQIAALIAALATLAILTSAISDVLYLRSELEKLLPAGLLGFLLFVTSQLFLYLTQRIRLSVAEAEQQARRRAEIQQLNELIVSRMRTGLVVLTPDGTIRLMNQSAAQLLDLPLSQDGSTANTHHFIDVQALSQCLQQWRHAPRARLKPLRLREGGPELQLSFAGLGQQAQSDVLVFVEDTREMAQQAQQLKLASLGHLTANIAHEVRNPLGAISHAAQLLSESEQLPAYDRRLAEIIQNHSRRVNQIIENVLQLSRRHKPVPEKIRLYSLLEQFIQHYRQSARDNLQITLDCPNHDISVLVDISQMEQVLGNLCDNALRYSKQQTGIASVTLRAYLDESLGNPCLDIIDQGPGVPHEQISSIFEPFFTTETQGTGLGLYLAREICEANQAQLVYKRTADGSSCFQINFSHPDKASPFT